MMLNVHRLEWFFLVFGLAALDAYIWLNTSTLYSQAYTDWAFDQRLRGLSSSVAKFAEDEVRTLVGRNRFAPEKPDRAVLPRLSEPALDTKIEGSRPAPSEVLGRLDIPGLNLFAMVREGADASTLRRAVGHIPGTALPGEKGNVALAGHRDTFFRALRDIQVHDPIQFETPAGIYRYQVESTRVVGPREIQVLASSRAPTLTLVTCYPFYYIGSAPKRFIVRATLVSAIPNG